MSKPLLWIFLLAGFTPVTAAPGEAPVGLQLDSAWVRVLPPSQKNTAAYVTVRNTGREPARIVGGTFELAERVQLHRSTESAGLVGMQQLHEVLLPPAEVVDFAPGGAHLMLLGLTRMPRPGESLQLCLELASGEKVCTAAIARKSALRPAEDLRVHPHSH